MHESVIRWLSAQADLVAPGSEVVEVGSYDVNGSVRSVLGHVSRHVGVDIRPGPAVDVVAVGARLPFRADRFDAGVYAETMEHDRAFWVTLAEFARVLRPGAPLLVTTRGIGFPLHDHPWDLWRFTAEGLVAAIEQAGLEVVDVEPDRMPNHPGWFVLARRPGTTTSEAATRRPALSAMTWPWVRWAAARRTRTDADSRRAPVTDHGSSRDRIGGREA